MNNSNSGEPNLDYGNLHLPVSGEFDAKPQHYDETGKLMVDATED